MTPQGEVGLKEKSRLPDSDRDNGLSSIIEVDTKNELTDTTPTNRVTSPTDGEDSITDISPEIISERFRDFLIKDKGISEDAAGEMSTHLEEFIQGHVSEIGAIQKLRTFLREGYHLPSASYSEARKNDPNLTAKKWFDDNYKAAALAGTVDTKIIQDQDPAFARAFNRARPGGLTLGEAISEIRKPKYEAFQLVLDSSMSTAERFLERIKTGRPAHDIPNKKQMVI